MCADEGRIDDIRATEDDAHARLFKHTSPQLHAPCTTQMAFLFFTTTTKPNQNATTALWATVQRICKETGVGGRVVLHGRQQRNSKKESDEDEDDLLFLHRHDDEDVAIVRVVDCNIWTARATARLRAEHPYALISVEPSTASLSGFVVAVSEQTTHQRRLRLRVLLAMLVLATIVALGMMTASYQQQEEETITNCSSSSAAAAGAVPTWWWWPSTTANNSTDDHASPAAPL